MISSFLSLLGLALPGYFLLNTKIFHQKNILTKIDKFIFGIIIWIFYIVTTILIVRIIFPIHIKLVFLFDYLLGYIIIGYNFLEVLKKFLYQHNYKISISCNKLKIAIILPFFIPIIVFIVFITIYTPIIYQHDATAVYLIEGKNLITDAQLVTETWPTFGDSMPLLPVIYCWFYQFSNTPFLRIIPIFFIFLIIILMYKIGCILFLNNIYVICTSIVALFSMMSIQWYMAKTSLYQDLVYMLFIALTFYIFLYIFLNKVNNFYYLIFGMSTSLLILSKEYGLFQCWFFVSSFIIIYIKNIYKPIRCLFQSILVIFPFIAYHFISIIIYSYYDKVLVNSITNYRTFLFILFLILFFIIYLKNNFQFYISKHSLYSMIILPNFIVLLYFINNIISLKAIVGSFLETYIQYLSNIGINFPRWEPTGPSRFILFFRPIDIYLTNSFLVFNIIPVLVFLFYFMRENSKLDNKPLNFLTLWFLYTLFIFYYFSLGYIKGDSIRVILPLAIPIALMIGKGIYNIFPNSKFLNCIGTIIYTFYASIYIFYIWFVKLDGTKWWLLNLNLLTTNYAMANYLEASIYAIPWILLLVITRNKSHLIKSKIFIKKHWSIIGIILILVSSLTPIMILYKATEYPKVWDPLYYDEADSVKIYSDYWLIPVIDYYQTNLNDDTSVTIGFGVTPLQYFLKRPFIDLIHPRNWIIYLPLLQNITKNEVLNYLLKFNMHYFLIPNEIYYSRENYEAVLKISTLFALINNSEMIINDDGTLFKFEKLAEFDSFKLYVLNYFPS